MARTDIYLNFPRSTEAAFNFYKTVFGGEFADGGAMRYGDMPPMDGMPPMAETDKNLIMHIGLPILGGTMLMGSDMPESMGCSVAMGNNAYISLSPDTREETDRLFAALSEGGKVEQPLQDMFWGAYYGTLTDQFGVHWMFNFCTDKK